MTIPQRLIDREPSELGTANILIIMSEIPPLHNTPFKTGADSGMGRIIGKIVHFIGIKLDIEQLDGIISCSAELEGTFPHHNHRRNRAFRRIFNPHHGVGTSGPVQRGH